MNEKILELAKQAGYTPLSGFDFANSLQEVFLKKFAELIVSECVNVLNAPGAMKVDERTLAEFSEYSQGWVNGRKLGIDHIKEHFGVK